MKKDRQEEQEEMETETPRVNPGYALGQIAKALTTTQEHEDVETRTRAQKKIAKWEGILRGLDTGSLDVGSCTPVKDVPKWATLEVATGGFATGALLAGGPLLEHETKLLADLRSTAGADARRNLNRFHLTDQGLARLQEMLGSGCYDVTVPEEGALLVVAWLVSNGRSDAARDLIEMLAPYFGRLRFYPVPIEQPRRFGTHVFVQDVAATIQNLKRIKPNEHILAQKEAIQVWTPLYDRMVGLFLETVDGESPRLIKDATGNGKFPTEGGWPCQQYPDGWKGRARAVLNECTQMQNLHKRCGRPERAKDSFNQLRDHLHCCVNDPSALTGREVGRIRVILARYVSKHGTPDSRDCRRIREEQTAQADGPTFHEISGVVISRLETHPGDSGLDHLSFVLQPVTEEESQRWRIGAGTAVPESVQGKVQRCLTEVVDVLVERGIVTSGETLARVLPQMTSGLQAAGIADPTLRQLHAAIYRAFRRRRSLLLLNLGKQIAIEDLPWIASIDPFRSDDLTGRDLSRQTLEEVTLLTLTSFPHMIIPNKLLQELKALAKGAGIDLPLVEEVAADIFMGQFSGKFVLAARAAADMLSGTLYARYYGIDYDDVRKIRELRGARSSWFSFSKPKLDPFAEYCSTRAGVEIGGWNPAINGMIIEQQQILTTQNLAVLFGGLGLKMQMEGQLEDMARRCFAWICRRQQVNADKWHALLIMLKNTAYAWRQMIFFLSLLPDSRQRKFIAWTNEHLGKQNAEYCTRFRPAMHGLELAVEGRSIDGSTGPDARRFLGWSKDRHWLLQDGHTGTSSDRK